MATARVAEAPPNDLRNKLLTSSKASDGQGRKAQSSQEEAQRAEVRALERIRYELRENNSQLINSNEVLEGSSERIKDTTSQYQKYEFSLDSASRLLGDLKRKTESDSRYIWRSFYFFLSVVAYIVLRRLKVFYALYFFASAGIWSGGMIYDTAAVAVSTMFGVVL